MSKNHLITVGFLGSVALLAMALARWGIRMSPGEEGQSYAYASAVGAGKAQLSPLAIEGFGRNATGGLGGALYVVTNLNDNGPCSFREAVMRKGPRIIKFAVSGTIVLRSPIEVSEPNMTIDGSEAPNQGVCISHGSLVLRADNMIIRYMRFRAGNLGTTTVDSLMLFDASNVVIDHCSIGWGDDGDLDIVGQSHDITVQWCILSENVGPGHNLIFAGANRVTIHHTLYAQGGRNPEYGSGDLDFVNNVIYRNYTGYSSFNNLSQIAPGCSIGDPPCGGSVVRANFVGNYYKAGSGESVTGGRAIWMYGDRHFSTRSSVYLRDNIGPSRTDDGLPQMDIAWQQDGGLPISSSRFDFPQVTTTDAFTAFDDVLNNAGATLPCRDSADSRVLKNVRKGSGATVSGVTDPTEVGGWPDLTQPCAQP
jgi:hypothetical protein